MKAKKLWTGSLLTSSLILMISFQNCSNTKMAFNQSATMASLSTSYSNDDSFTTNENTPLNAAPTHTLAIQTGFPSVFSQSTTPSNGTISNYNSATGAFTYTPNTDFVGLDSFQYSELATGATTAVTRRININVLPVNSAPWMDPQTFEFSMDSTQNPMPLVGKDKVDPNPRVLLDLKGFVKSVTTKHGTVTMSSAGSFAYTPQPLFRGLDSVQVTIVNEFGLSSTQTVTINIGNPFMNLEPALAVRGPGCVNCHANVASRFITDVGFGSSYFFGQPNNPFIDGGLDFYGDRGGTSWISASFSSDILVPKAPFNFSLSNYATQAKMDTKPPQYAAQTVAQYISAIEGQVTHPATSVTEKNNIYIGAPTEALLNSRTGGTGTAAYNFVKDDQDTSPNLSGLVDKGAYLTADGSGLVCDGDLVISKTLYLNNVLIITANGCRIYSTQSIFVQGPISYQKLDPNATDNTNLQLVSTRWVNLGVGPKNCENATTNPGWYSQDTQHMALSPANFRLTNYPAPTRNSPSLNAAGTFNLTLLSELQNIPNFEDGSCRTPSAGSTPRQVSFERLLINAPRVDSRYTGQFTGVLVTEIPLMSLSAFSYSYDTVFNRVSVLPLMQASDFLSVQ